MKTIRAYKWLINFSIANSDTIQKLKSDLFRNFYMNGTNGCLQIPYLLDCKPRLIKFFVHHVCGLNSRAAYIFLCDANILSDALLSLSTLHRSAPFSPCRLRNCLPFCFVVLRCLIRIECASTSANSTCVCQIVCMTS